MMGLTVAHFLAVVVESDPSFGVKLAEVAGAASVPVEGAAATRHRAREVMMVVLALEASAVARAQRAHWTPPEVGAAAAPVLVVPSRLSVVKSRSTTVCL